MESIDNEPKTIHEKNLLAKRNSYIFFRKKEQPNFLHFSKVIIFSQGWLLHSISLLKPSSLVKKILVHSCSRVKNLLPKIHITVLIKKTKELKMFVIHTVPLTLLMSYFVSCLAMLVLLWRRWSSARWVRVQYPDVPQGIQSTIQSAQPQTWVTDTYTHRQTHTHSHTQLNRCYTVCVLTRF